MHTYTDELISKKQNHYTQRYLPIIASLLLIFSLFMVSQPTLKAQIMPFLNQEEIKWLAQQQTIKIGITTLPNQILIKENGAYTGFSVDIFQKIQEALGIHFKYVYFDTWSELMAAGMEERIDVIFLAQKTKDRLSHFDFTDAVITQQNKIISKIEGPHHLTIEDLLGKDVAVAKGSALFEYLTEHFTGIHLIPTSNEQEALTYVAKNIADATISESVRASYYLRQLNIKNLRISGDLDYDYHLRIASRSSLPILNIILTKAIDRMPTEDIQALHLKWGYIKNKEGYLDKQTLIYLGIVFSIIIPFTFYVFMLNKHLRTQVAEKRAAILALKTAHDEIHHLKEVAEQEARTDYLTDVLNKRGFYEELRHHIEKYKRTQDACSLVMIDIDFFKKINDTMGHDTGDMLLSELTKIIKNNLRPYDYMGRVGGEEFALLYPNTHLDEAVEITERIRLSIHQHTFNINHFTFQISASFGVSEITEQDSIISFFKRTDKLLYQSKLKGRNRVSF